MQKFIEILAERCSARLGRKVETYDVETALFKIILFIVAVCFIVFWCWFSAGIEEKNAEIAAAFVKHFTNLK